MLFTVGLILLLLGFAISNNLALDPVEPLFILVVLFKSAGSFLLLSSIFIFAWRNLP